MVRWEYAYDDTLIGDAGNSRDVVGDSEEFEGIIDKGLGIFIIAG
jgi:hypothetical protein